MTTIFMSALTAASVYLAITSNQPATYWAGAVFCGLVTIVWGLQDATR